MEKNLLRHYDTDSFVCIMLIYELLVKRIDLLRFLFGMKPKKGGRKGFPIPS